MALTHPHSDRVWLFFVLLDLVRLLVGVLLFLCALRAPFAACGAGSTVSATDAGAAGAAMGAAAGATSTRPVTAASATAGETTAGARISSGIVSTAAAWGMGSEWVTPTGEYELRVEAATERDAPLCLGLAA